MMCLIPSRATFAPKGKFLPAREMPAPIEPSKSLRPSCGLDLGTSADRRGDPVANARPYKIHSESPAASGPRRGAQDVSRARRAEVIDSHAAAFILQGALDRLRVILG
jgi:hypothetical protein